MGVCSYLTEMDRPFRGKAIVSVPRQSKAGRSREGTVSIWIHLSRTRERTVEDRIRVLVVPFSNDMLLRCFRVLPRPLLNRVLAMIRESPALSLSGDLTYNPVT